uniref:Uncharacterized protein n=1 Tax=Cyanoptyche gloeocystis TaxID=77922 RepID=A0A7S2JL52_9EUKA
MNRLSHRPSPFSASHLHIPQHCSLQPCVPACPLACLPAHWCFFSFFLRDPVANKTCSFVTLHACNHALVLSPAITPTILKLALWSCFAHFALCFSVAVHL